jgi:hypothetical protein
MKVYGLWLCLSWNLRVIRYAMIVLHKNWFESSSHLFFFSFKIIEQLAATYKWDDSFYYIVWNESRLRIY